MEKVKLGDVSKLINGDRGKNYPSQADITEDGEIPFVNAGHLNGRSIDFSEMNYISQEKYEKLSSGKFQMGDILYCLRGSLGKKAIVHKNVNGAIASSLVIIRPDTEKVSGEYLMLALDSPAIREQLVKANNGSSQPNLSAASVREYEVELPTLSVQKEVAEKLVKVRNVIDSRQQELQLLDDLIKARFVELFGDPANNGKGWVIKDLETVTTIVTYGLTVRPEYIDEGIDLVSARELHKGFVAYDEAPKISEQDFEKLSDKGKPHVNDILFSKTGSIGHCALVEDDKPFAITQNAARIGLNTELVNPLWLLNYLRMDFIQDWCKGHAKGNAVKDFQLQDMKVIPLFDCPLELQEQFAAFVKQVDKSKVVIRKAFEETQRLFDSLMQEYFG